MNTINEYIVEELQERSGNDLNIYKSNSDAAMGFTLNSISDFRFSVHQKYLDMITTELISISPNMDKSIINQINNYDFNKFDFFVTNLTEEHIKSFNFKYLVNYCRLVETLLNNVIKNKVDDRAMVDLLEETTIFRLEKQTVVGNIRYGKDLSDLKDTIEYSKIKVDNDYFDGTVVPFVNSFKANQNDYRRTITEYSKVIGIIQTFTDRLINLMKENRDNPFTNDKIVHKIIVKSIRILDKVTGFVTFCVLLKAQELVSKVISVQGLYNDMLNANIVATEGFNGNIIFPTDTHSLAEDMIINKCSAFIELSNRIYSYYTLKLDQSYQLMYSDMYDEPVKDKERKYNNEPYVDVVNAIGIISRGLDKIGKEGDQYLMMFDDVLKETGLNIPLRQKYKNVLETLANDIEKEPPLLDTDNVDRKLWELIGFKKNVEALTGLVYDTYRKIQLLLERFSNNINSEYKDVDTINSYKVFLTDFIDTYKDFITDVCGALITRLNNINDSLEKSTETVQSNYTKPAVTDSQLSLESFNFLDIVFNESVDYTKDKFRYNFICLENEYVRQKYLRDTGYQLIIEEDNNANNNSGNNNTANNPQNNSSGSGNNSTTNSSNNNQQNNNQNQSNQNQNGQQNQQNADKTKVQINDGDKGGKGGKSTDSLKDLIKKIIDKIINAFRDIAEKMASKNDEWLTRNKEALLNRSYVNVTINILPYHNLAPTAFVDGIKKLSTNVTSLTSQVVGTLGTEKNLHDKLFTFIDGGVNSDDIATSITNYYKVGNAKLETVEVANGALKSQIDGEMIPYCEKYRHDFLNQLTQSLESLKTTAEQQVEKLKAGDVDNNLSEKIEWLNDAIGKFCGSICNAARDRYTDYFKVLFALLPKTATPNNNNNQNNNQNNQQNNNQNNQNNQPNNQNNNNNQGDQNNNGNGNQG